MNKLPRLSLLFYLMIIAQLAVPIYIIIRQENTLSEGARYKFRIQPFDPYDAFRGRYLSIQTPAFKVKLPENEAFKNDQIVYGLLLTDENGFTAISNIRSFPPENSPYLKVKISYLDYYDKDRAFIYLPFDRYYIEEKYASEVESLFWQSRGQDWRNRDAQTYIVVRIKDGYGVLEELYIFGQPVMEYVLEHQKKK